MDQTPEKLQWKRPTAHLAAQDVRTLEETCWEMALRYDEEGPEAEGAGGWIETGLDCAQRLKEIALQNKSAKILEVAYLFGKEFQACANQFNAAQQYKLQQSRIVRATSGEMMPPPNHPGWRK